MTIAEKYDLKQFKNRINWEITQQCNFNCSYCSGYTTVNKSPVNKIYTPQQINEFFNNTNRNWLILITGGEPFLYPEFVEICKLLTINHHLQITSNLSHSAVKEFANLINPKKVFNISASYHHEIRNNTTLKDDFLNSCIELQQKGFPVLVNIIAHPKYFNNLENDIRFFQNNGLETIVFGFRGTYNDKVYPQSFNTDELEIIKKYSLDDTEIKIALNQLNFYGTYCEAGVNYFGVKQNGDIIRCYSLPNTIGNLYNGNFPVNNKIKPCISHQCIDCYNGVASVTNKKAGWYKMYRMKNELNETK